MNITPEQFLEALKSGKTVHELNRDTGVMPLEVLRAMRIRKNPPTLKYLVRYLDHTEASAYDYLTTDFSNGYTLCGRCGSFCHLGKGFTKRLSNGCLHCEGEEKHPVYWNNGSKRHGFRPRYMSMMFDDGMHYHKDELEIEKFKDEVKGAGHYEN